MSGKLSLPEQVKKEALIGTAFSWLSEQKDEILGLLLALREQPIPTEKLKESLALPVIDRELVQMIFFSGKTHCALTEVGEAVLKKIECVIEQYNRITNPSEIPEEETISNEKEREIRFRNRLEHLSEHHWAALLTRYWDGQTFGRVCISGSENKETLKMLTEEQMLYVTQSVLGQDDDANVYSLTSFGLYCVEKYIQHVYSEIPVSQEHWKTLEEFNKHSVNLPVIRSYVVSVLNDFARYGVTELRKKQLMPHGETAELYALTQLGKACLVFWKKNQQNEHTEN